MKILRKMVFREFLGVFFASISAITILFLLVDFFDRHQRFVGEEGAPVKLLVLYLLYKLPQILYEIIPLDLPLAVLVMLGIFSRRNELVAIRAAGIPIRKVLRPVFFLSIFIAASMFFISDRVLPVTNIKQNLINSEIKSYKTKRRQIEKGKISTALKETGTTVGGWYRGAKGLYYLRGYNANKDMIRNLVVFEMGRNFKIEKRIEAHRATWKDDKWVAENATIREFTEDGNAYMSNRVNFVVDIPETNIEIRAMEKTPAEMGFFELNEYIGKLEAAGSDMRSFRVDLLGKLAYPLSGLILLILAIPLGLKSGRGTGVAGGVVWSLVISLTYFEFNAWALSLGRGGAIQTPEIAAGIAPLLFGLIALPMYFRSN